MRGGLFRPERLRPSYNYKRSTRRPAVRSAREIKTKEVMTMKVKSALQAGGFPFTG